MLLMLRKMLGRTILVTILGVTPAAMAASACPVITTAPRDARIFANVDARDAWREFLAMPQLSTLSIHGGMLAEYWQESKKGITAFTIERGQNFWISTRYCFDDAGNLEGVGFQIDTALGWGHRIEGSFSGAGFKEISSEFFDLNNGKVVPKPGGVADVPRALKPILYLNQGELPFASLIMTSVKVKKNERGAGAPAPTESVAETPRTPAGN